jgi:hypothetical protein
MSRGHYLDPVDRSRWRTIGAWAARKLVKTGPFS